MTAPTYKLLSGSEMPAIGMGTFGSDKYSPEEIANAVYGGVKDTGFRLIDCAEVYGNEKEIGEAINRLLSEKVVTREELFITSKVWNNHHRNVRAACEESLKNLGLDYIDAYFIHWPFPNYHAPGCSGDARNPDSKPFSVDEYMDTYSQCLELYKEGKIKAIGMSNMTIPKLEAVLPKMEVMPCVLEMELHPAFQQKELFKYAADKGILPIGFCPLGSPSRPERDRTAEDISDMDMPEIKAIAEKHGIHPAGICIKWAHQVGACPIPFSVKPSQYTANLEYVCKDPLTDDEMKILPLHGFVWNERKNNKKVLKKSIESSRIVVTTHQFKKETFLCSV